MTAASAPSRAPAQADAAPGSSYQSIHAVMALLGSHLAASIPHDASGEAAWTAASQALVQFIQESSRAEQRPKPLLERLQGFLTQHEATAAVAAAAQQASESGDPSDPQNLQWLCCASAKQQQLMQQIVGMIWDPRSEEKADKCLNAVACAVIKHWCTPQMLEKLKEDLASMDPGQPVAPSSLFRPGAARDNAPDVPMWSMDMPQAVDVARYQGLLEDQRVTTSKQIQTIFEQDDRLRCFKLSAPKAGLGIKLHWISILHSYRKVVKQKAERERERLARKEQERIAQKEREQKAQADREQKAQAEREQKAQADRDKKLLEDKQSQLQMETSPGSQAQAAQPGATEARRQADLAGRTPLHLGSIKNVIIQACKEKAFRPGAGSAEVSFQRDSLLRQTACSLLLDGFCTRHGVSGTKAKVQAADLAEYHQAAGQLGAGILSKLAAHPAFKHNPNPSKGYLQVLMGDSEKHKHLPGDCICSTSARPFMLTMMQGCDWRVQFNVDFIWEAAATSPAAPNAAAPNSAAPNTAAPNAAAPNAAARGAESDTSSGAAAANGTHGTHAQAANGVKQGKGTGMKQTLGSSSGALDVLPMWVLLKKVGTLLPLSTKPGVTAVTKRTLLFHLAARAVLSSLASSMLPDPGGATPADMKHVLVSRQQISTFVVAATRACEYIQSMLVTGSYSKYAGVAGEGPTRGLIALLQSAICAEKKTPMFRLTLHADRCTWSVGLMADWIWVGAEDVQGLPLQPALSAATASEGGPASAAAAKPVHSKGAPVLIARFAGIELDPVLEVQLSELPAASFKGLLHAAAMACTALDIVSKFKEHSKSHTALRSKESQAVSASASDPQKPKPGGADSSTGKVVLEDRILMQTAVEVLLEGYSRTFKTETIPAVKLAKYAPSFHTMADRVCTKAKLRLTEHSSQFLQDRAPVVQALRSCIQAQASSREPPLIVLTTVGGTVRVSLEVQRLWACLPQPAVSKSKASAAAQGGQAPVRPAAQPAAMPQPQPAAQVPQQSVKAQQQLLDTPQTLAGGASVQPTARDNGSTVSNGHPAFPGSSHPTAGLSSASGHPPWQAPGTAAAWQAPTAAPPFQAVGTVNGLARSGEGVPTAYTPPAAAAAADFSTMLQAGLPAEWNSPSQLMEFWQVLLGAVDLVWPHPRPDSASSQDVAAFVCNVVAKQAVDAGIQQHLHRLAQRAVRTEPQAFAVRLQAAGQAAIDAWQAAGGGGSGAELLSRGPLYAGVLVAAWHQEQPAEQAPLLRVLNMAETDPGAATAVVTVVRLDAAGLLDLASSIQFADELALDLLL